MAWTEEKNGIKIIDYSVLILNDNPPLINVSRNTEYESNRKYLQSARFLKVNYVNWRFRIHTSR